MNRRQFFKTVAATAATAAAAVVAPAVVVAPKVVPFKPNRAQAIILDKFSKQYQWAMYHDPLICLPIAKK